MTFVRKSELIVLNFSVIIVSEFFLIVSDTGKEEPQCSVIAPFKKIKKGGRNFHFYYYYITIIIIIMFSYYWFYF